MKTMSFFRALFTILFTSVICATTLIFFSPGKEYIETYQFNEEDRGNTLSPATVAGNRRKIIGIISGHYGYDSGFQCGPDYNFVKESDVNLRVAVMVRDYLLNRGYDVNLLHEFDPALSNYTGLALVSIHSNDCEPGGRNHSGFNVSIAGQNAYPSESERLNDCIKNRYAQNTNLTFLGENYDIGNDMMYSFNTVNDYTTISVVHTGYLANDYRFISQQMDKVAKGIGDGIICYVENETIGNFNSAFTSQEDRPTVDDSDGIQYDIPLSLSLQDYEQNDD